MDPAIVPFVVQEGHGVPWPLKSAKATRSDRPGKGSPCGRCVASELGVYSSFHSLSCTRHVIGVSVWLMLTALKRA
jgi:hypothetical protein